MWHPIREIQYIVILLRKDNPVFRKNILSKKMYVPFIELLKNYELFIRVLYEAIGMDLKFKKVYMTSNS